MQARRLELYPSKWVVGMFAAIGVFGVGMGIALWTGALDSIRTPPRAGERAASSVLILAIGGWMLAWFLPMLLWPRPTIVADDSGLHDRRRLLSIGTIEWGRIEGLAFSRAGNHSALGIWLHEPQRFIETRPAWQRPALRLRTRLGMPTARIVVLSGSRRIREFADEAARTFGVEREE